MHIVDEIVQQLKEGAISNEEAIKKVEKPWKHISEIKFRVPYKALSTGIDCLDVYAPLKEGRGELVVLGARPGMGKSALMFQIASHVAKTRNALVFSMEMEEEDVLDRIFSNINQIQPHKAKVRGQNFFDKAKGALNELKLKIVSESKLDTTMISNIAESAHKEDPLSLVVVDYLGLIRLPGVAARHEELGNVTKELVRLAKKLKCPVLVASQLNRQVDTRGKSKNPNDSNYKPVMSDLKDSGDVEADASVVMFLSRQSVYDGSRPEEADIEVVKNRAGKVGGCVVRFNSDLTTFRDEGGDY